MRTKKFLLPSATALAVVAAGATYILGAAGVNSKALRNAVMLEGVRAHQQALRDAADGNDGTRTSGTPGFDASLRYVKQQLDAAGYVTSV